MGFWDIFWPVFASLVCIHVLLEGAHFFLGMWYAKKQQKLYEEQMSKMVSGLDPAVSNMFSGLTGGFNGAPPLPYGENPQATTSGASSDLRDHTGQYV